MSYLKPIICMLLSLSLVGCAVSKNPNPVIRYGANAGATLALPGLAGAATIAVVAGAADEDDKDNSYVSDSEKKRRKERDDAMFTAFGISLAVAGIGCLVGGLIGGTVGFFKWMFNGFEDDHDKEYSDLPEEILPPVKDDEYKYGSKLK